VCKHFFLANCGYLGAATGRDHDVCIRDTKRILDWTEVPRRTHSTHDYRSTLPEVRRIGAIKHHDIFEITLSGESLVVLAKKKKLE